MSERRAVTVILPPTYGYMRRDEFYAESADGNLMNERVDIALREMIYTDRKGRNLGADMGICRIPREGRTEI